MMPPAGSKSVSELAEIAQQAGVPFIVKGIMTAKAALKAQQAGAQRSLFLTTVDVSWISVPQRQKYCRR